MLLAVKDWLLRTRQGNRHTGTFFAGHGLVSQKWWVME